jgi:large subunit ribosomal protein L13
MATTRGRLHSRPSRVEPAWHVIDAKGKTLGRVSTAIAMLLQGKHRPTYVPYLNTGDFVVVINAAKFHVTGNKLEDKRYYRHSGYHGGLKERTLSQILKTDPTRALKHAVKGMLPKNTLGRHMLSRLKLYAGESHPHAAQINAGARQLRAEEAAAAAAAAAPEEAVVEAPAENAAPEAAAVEAGAGDRAAEATAEARDADAEAPVAEAKAPQEAAAEADEDAENSNAKPRRTRSRAKKENSPDDSSLESEEA